MFETVEDILRVTSFMAVGGLIAIVFFFVFAQTITGSRTIHKQLDKLIRQNEEIADALRKLQSPAQQEKPDKKDAPD